MFQHAAQVHLTILMLRLYSPDDLAKAQDLLRGVQVGVELLFGLGACGCRAVLLCFRVHLVPQGPALERWWSQVGHIRRVLPDTLYHRSPGAVTQRTTHVPLSSRIVRVVWVV